MNHWKDDERRHHMHRRGVIRRFRGSLRTLMAVLGWLSLTLALLIAGFTWPWRESPLTQRKLFTLSGGYAAAGGVLIIAHFACFILPDKLKKWRSESERRRSKERAGSRKAPARPAAAVEVAPPSPAGRPSPAGKEGVALVLVLVMLALVATLVAETQFAARALARRNDAVANVSVLRRAAADAARAALQRIADDADLLVDYTNETCFAAEELATPDGIATRVTVVDESRAFDANNLAAANAPARRMPGDILADLITLSGNFSPSAYVSGLGDWVDADDDGVKESGFYLARDPAFEAPNRMLYDWRELLAVDGGNREMFQPRPRGSALDLFSATLTDGLTVCPVRRTQPLPVNINTATPEALRGIMGIGQDEIVRTILALRMLQPIRDIEPIFIAVDPEFTEIVRPYLDVRSRMFRVDARAYAKGRGVDTRALASRDSAGRVEIIQWIF